MSQKQPLDEDAQLAALLKSVDGHVDDNGFTNAVMARVPPSRPAWMRLVPVGLGALAAVVLALVTPEVRTFLGAVFGGAAWGATGAGVGVVTVGAVITLVGLCVMPAFEES